MPRVTQISGIPCPDHGDVDFQPYKNDLFKCGVKNCGHVINVTRAVADVAPSHIELAVDQILALIPGAQISRARHEPAVKAVITNLLSAEHDRIINNGTYFWYKGLDSTWVSPSGRNYEDLGNGSIVGQELMTYIIDMSICYT